MNKFIKILLAVEFILISAIIALNLAGSGEMPTAYAVKEVQSIEDIDFKLLTKAVCENSSEHVFCRDELFIKCNGSEFMIKDGKLDNFTECGARLKLSGIAVNGSAKLGKDWADPRR